MATPVTREQFIVTDVGISHKPTGAMFIAHSANSVSGNFRYGQLGNVLPNGDEYREDQVRLLMNEIWEHFISK